TPDRAIPGAHEHDVALAHLDAGRLELVRGDDVVRRRPLRAGHVEQYAARDERLHRLDAVLAEAGGGLDLRVDAHAAVELHVLGLVRERVDVRAGVFGHHDDAARARARL